MAKKKCPEFENHERWLVSYADMVTLLFAVFVVLYALNLSDTPQKPTEEVAGSMQESFNTPLEDIPVNRRIGPTEAGFGIFESMKGGAPKGHDISNGAYSEEQIRIIQDEMRKVQIELENRLYGPGMFPSGRSPGEQRIVDVERTGRGFKVSLAARHFYAPGSTTIKESARKDLEIVVQMLKRADQNITVEGHTDSSSPRGKLSNWDLSALRASHMVEYMIQKQRFPASRLSAAGYADTQPISHNGTASGREMNRRVEFHVNYDANSPSYLR